MGKGDVAFLLTVLLFMFLFYGEPDVFDALIKVTQAWLLKQ